MRQDRSAATTASDLQALILFYFLEKKMHLSIPERCLLFGALSLLLLCGEHCAKALSAGEPCDGSEMCDVGLACIPESPGSSTSICQGILI